MTYGTLKSITTGLLIGDNVLPSDGAVLIGLLEYAMSTVAMQADSLHLMTLNADANILRRAQGDYLIRTPSMPLTDDEHIDIDDELAFAVARYLASYVSRDKGGIHVQAADRIIKDYNAKTWELLGSTLYTDAETGEQYVY